MKKRRSPIWALNKKEFQKLFDENSTVTAILKFFGLKNHGDNFKTVKNRVIEENICLDKFLINKSKITKKGTKYGVSLKTLLIENGKHGSKNNLKKRLLKENLLKNSCNKCGLGTEWQGEPLVLQLEHKNGISNDNRLENLCLLCPNCHSQTKTFAGRNFKKEKRPKKNYYIARPKIKRSRKVPVPSKEELEKLLWEIPSTKIAEFYGISDVMVGKWAKECGLKKPGRGYWNFKKRIDKENQKKENI